VFDAQDGTLANTGADHTRSSEDNSLSGQGDQFMFRFRKPE